MAARHLTARLRPHSPVVAAFLAALWGVSLLPLVFVASANARLVEAFATDEVLQLNLLRGAAENHTFALIFGPYGHLVFNMILLVLRIIPGELSDARIIHTARALSIVFATATVWLTFAFARRAFGATAAWIAFAAVCLNATLYAWGPVLKPDMAQLFFLMLALAMTCRLADDPRLRWLAWASCAAGLAFACKYSGLFVLPIVAVVCVLRPLPAGHVDARVMALRGLAAAKAVALFVASLFMNATWIAAHLTEDGRIDMPLSPQTLTAGSAALRGAALVALAVVAAPWLWSALRKRPRLVAVLWAWTVAVAAFAAAFVVASPYSLRRAAFLKGLFAEASYAEPMSAAWVSTWFHGIGTAVAWPVFVVAVVTMAWLALNRRARVSASEWILMAWVVLYALVLSAPVHEFYVHYALPLAPPAAMLAGRGGAAAAEWLGSGLARRGLAWILVLVVLFFSGRDLLSARTQLLNRERTSDAVFLGRWLECRAPDSTRVAYDYFSYVPPVFRDASPTWGGTREWLSRFDPDIVIVNSVTATEVMVEARHAEYYECLAGERCGYERVFVRGDFTMFARSGQADALRASPPASTPGCTADTNP